MSEESFLRPELDKVTRIACSLLSLIEGMGADLTKLDPETRQWWEQHKAADAARRAREEEARRKVELREQALAKLTPEERAAISSLNNPYGGMSYHPQ